MSAPEPQAVNVVVVGAWNQAIFTPEWMGKNVLTGEGSLEMFVSLGAVHSVRFLGHGLEIEIAPGRITVQANSVHADDLSRIEGAAREILKLLTHTPVQAVGVNVTFGSASEPPRFFAKEQAANLGSRVVGHSASWTVAEGPDEINIRMAQANADAVTTTVNVHRPTATAELARETLENRLPGAVTRARELVAKFWSN